MTVLSFKVKVENGNLHRFGLRKPTLSTLLEALSSLGLPSDLQLSYMDEFEDEVTFFTDFEFEELARIHHDKVVRLFAKPKRVSSPAAIIINPTAIPSTNALSTASSSASTNTLPAVTATTSTNVDIKPRKVGKASSDAKVEFKPKRQTFAAFRAKLNSVSNDLAERERLEQERLEREIEIEKLKLIDFSYARMLDKMAAEKLAMDTPALTSANPDITNTNININNNNNNALGANTATSTISNTATNSTSNALSKQGVVASMVSKIDQLHSQSATLSLSPPSARLALRARLEMRKWSASFIEDATLIDGPRPAGTHRKTWVVRNDGVNTWDGVRIVYIGGKGGKSIGFGSAPVPVTKPCEIAVVSVDVVVPPEPGRYIAFFKLNNPRGKRFGPRLWVEVTVAPNSDTPLSLESTIQTARNRGFKQPKHILEDLHAIHNGDIDKIVAELSIINDASSSTRSGGVNYWIGRKAFAMEESPGCATAQTALSSRREIASKVFGTSLVTPRLLDDNRGDLVKTIESLRKYRADSESSASAEAGGGDDASSSGEYETEEEEEEVVEEKASTNDMEEANKILRANAAAMAYAIPSTPTKSGHNRKSSWEML